VTRAEEEHRVRGFLIVLGAVLMAAGIAGFYGWQWALIVFGVFCFVTGIM
jgi:hypothetical protein